MLQQRPLTTGILAHMHVQVLWAWGLLISLLLPLALTFYIEIMSRLRFVEQVLEERAGLELWRAPAVSSAADAASSSADGQPLSTSGLSGCPPSTPANLRAARDEAVASAMRDSFEWARMASMVWCSALVCAAAVGALLWDILAGSRAC